MSTTTSLELEIIPAEVKSAVTELSAPADKALAIFAPFKGPFEAAAELLLKEAAASDSPTARRLRLDMVKARSAIGAVKKSAKADVLLVGNLIDWYYSKGVAQLEESEARLEAIEKAAERAEAARKLKLATERGEQLKAYGVDPAFYSLGEMADEGFAALLNGSRLAHEAKVAAAAKAEAERIEAARVAEEARIAKENADAEERARIAAENARLKAEREESDRIAKIEREKAAAALAAAEESARVERERVAKEKAEAEKAAAEKLAAQEAHAKAERDAIEAKAKAEREAAAEVARVEREKREALERAERERVAAEQKRQKDEADALARAAAAPDREKLFALAALAETMEVPEMSTKAGKVAASLVRQYIFELSANIRTAAEKL